ncbi:hypothetical protein predicted by Glimmer/Critica [Streptococcus dysgalactiae subsp. equisimilis AC-2713]|uniref:Transposase n=1 Tax=Streptococcus dysgalactiae subsp. equisimilis AC-2713 TaxID=759913 RepID=A0AB33R5W9_STREQ|nr:hypothetical protein predicted by Glimmer/Critica [Streptococcus dysgalactiae subsp. equisimilis AC-2713]
MKDLTSLFSDYFTEKLISLTKKTSKMKLATF